MPTPHGPSLLLVGKDFQFAVFLSLWHEGRGSKTVVEEPPLKEGAIGFKHGAQGEGSDPLPITNILLPFQEGGPRGEPQWDQLLSDYCAQAAKAQGLGTSSSKRSADLPQEAAVHREWEDGEKQDSSPPNSC